MHWTELQIGDVLYIQSRGSLYVNVWMIVMRSEWTLYCLDYDSHIFGMIRISRAVWETPDYTVTRVTAEDFDKHCVEWERLSVYA